MGSGASTLTPAQKASVSKEIQAIYEKCAADGLDDDIIQDIVTNEYKKLVKSVQAQETTSTAKGPPAGSLSSKFGGKSGQSMKGGVSSKDNKPAKVTRRRSFDRSRASGGGKKALIAMDQSEIQEMLASQSETVLKPAEEPPVDSWDSVSQQPFCNVCQMAFKSPAFLDRHTKYSDLHLKNVERKMNAGKSPEEIAAQLSRQASLAAPPVQPEEPAVTALPEPQLEGTHFKLIYTGSKFFWRTQKSFDVDIYLHVLPHVLEVICFDPAKHKETTRLYLNFAIVEVSYFKFCVEICCKAVVDRAVGYCVP